MKLINVIGWNIKILEKYILIPYSRTIFNKLYYNNKINFKKLKVNSKKLISTELHLKSNLTCLKENLLPTYMNIHIYIYIYIPLFCPYRVPMEIFLSYFGYSTFLRYKLRLFLVNSDIFVTVRVHQVSRKWL